MFELLPITIFSFLMAVFSDYASKYNIKIGKYEKKDNIYYIIMAIPMILFVGLRNSYNDTYTYLESYILFTPNTIPDVTDIDWSIGSNPGFNLINWTIKYLGFSSQDFLMLYAVITIFIYLWFIRKYTSNILFSIFLFFVTGCFTFTLAAIKQTVAVAFCLVATDRAINNNKRGFFIWIIIATLFHPYSLMFLSVPFMMFKPWTKKTYYSLLLFGLVGISLQFLLGSIVNITSMMGETYDVNSFSGAGVNPFRLIVCAAPLILSYFMKKDLENISTSKCDNLMLNLTMINAEIMFVGLFGTANYFARLANYFLIFQCLSLPWLFNFLNKKNRKILGCIAVFAYLYYYYYSNMYSNFSNFDSQYNSISLVDYILSFF